MLSKRDIEQIRGFRSPDHPVVSVYLNTDGKSGSKGGLRPGSRK